MAADNEVQIAVAGQVSGAGTRGRARLTAVGSVAC